MGGSLGGILHLMKILVIHNAYQQRGGEDVVFGNEVALLKSKGHDVREFKVNNYDIDSFLDKLRAAFGVTFSVKSYLEVRRTLNTFRPDVVHVHNFFPLISPSVFYACRRAFIPSVFTLHNYRVLCPTAFLMHNGIRTEASLRNGPWWAVPQRVYRGSFVGTFAVASMISIHKAAGTWSNCVTRFIALSKFASATFAEAGLPVSRIKVKPNFVDIQVPIEGRRRGLLFVGRLSSEKGLDVLSAATQLLGCTEKMVKVVGDGPMASSLNSASGIEFLGPLGAPSVYEQMANSQVLLVPSLWHESFGMVVIEAFACGLPVIASRLGALSELVEDGVTGLLVEPGSAKDLAEKMRWAIEHPEAMLQMGRAARARYEERYTSEINYSQLMGIYEEAIEANRRGRNGCG